MNRHSPSTYLDKVFIGDEPIFRHLLISRIAIFCSLLVSVSVLWITWRVENIFNLSPFVVLFIKALIYLTVVNDLVNVLGHVLLRHHSLKNKKLMPSDTHLVVQFISRGENIEVLKESVECAYEMLLEEATIKFSIRIVTEKEVSSNFNEAESDLFQFIVVPSEFRTKNNSLYKARGLEYARLVCDASDGDQVANENKWILYFDEETLITKSSIRGVLEFIEKDENRDKFGQGLLTYTGRGYDKSIVSSAAEIKRVGYNLGRYYLQYAVLNDIYFGFQGSYFCASSALINKITFDFGPKESITEDIFFAFFASLKGFKCCWIQGHAREQPPENVCDLLRQRRRWLIGFTSFLFSKKIPLIRRLILLIFITLPNRMWGFAPIFLGANFIYLSTISDAYNFEFTTAIITYLLFIYLILFFQSNYLIGLLYTIEDLNSNSRLKKFLFAIKCSVALPFAVLIEQFVTIYSLFPRKNGFEVIKKNVS